VLATTLFDARAFPLVRSANRDLEAQMLESAELERELDFNVAETFVEVLSAERLRDASARRIEVAQAVLADASLRRDAGLAAVNDVTRSDLELANARLTLTQAENLVRSARLGLGYLVGTPVDGPLTEPPPVEHPELVAEALVERAGASRADLQALEKRAEAFRQRSRAPRLGIIPTLGVAATQRYTNEAGLSGNKDDWNVGATLTWEIFDGGTRYAVADQLEAQALEAELDSAALRRRIDLEVRSALADLASASAAVEQSEVQTRVAAQNAEEVRQRFANGLATALEQADATAAAFEADADFVRARLARALATLALRRALGDGPLGAEEASPQAIEETR
jgi:outer membrane protein TolC